MKIGRILKETRIKKGITLSEASNALLIQESYLEAIEDNIDDSLPTGVYKLIYTRAYCRYLGVEYREDTTQKPKKIEEKAQKIETKETDNSSEGESLELSFPFDINRSFRVGVKVIVTLVVIFMIVKLFQLIF